MTAASASPRRNGKRRRADVRFSRIILLPLFFWRVWETLPKRPGRPAVTCLHTPGPAGLPRITFALGQPNLHVVPNRFPGPLSRSVACDGQPSETGVWSLGDGSFSGSSSNVLLVAPDHRKRLVFDVPWDGLFCSSRSMKALQLKFHAYVQSLATRLIYNLCFFS